MNTDEISTAVKEKFSLNILEIEKIKNVYKIRTEDSVYCLKVIGYTLGHFLFILAAIKHLQENGFKNIPEIIVTADKEEYIASGSKYAYLTKWVNGRECNYDNPIEIDIAAEKLAELHLCSQGFAVSKIMEPRIGWFKWIDTFRTRKSEILDFKKRICSKWVKTDFDRLYEEVLEDEYERAESAVKNLAESRYFERMKEEICSQGFCHHDFAHHNILIGCGDEVNVIDFDYCILDIHLHDLASLLIRRMKNGKWSLDDALSIIGKYSSINYIEQDDLPIMAAFIEFPQEFWQLGIQYYWEKQDWKEEFFMKKLVKFIEDRSERQEFVYDLKAASYGR